MSEGFSYSWLDLREPVDTAARDTALLERLAGWCRERDRLHVVDLGSGTGANLRRTAPLIGREQDWTLVEWDADLIAAGSPRLVDSPVAWRYRQLDLAQDLEKLAEQPCDLITASALLDLVSVDWLDRLAALRRELDAALYVALSYDGRIAWDPADPADQLILGLVNDHQRTDKGLGQACGPDAVTALVERLQPDEGMTVLAPSDWVLDHRASRLQAEMVHGHRDAALAMAPDRSDELRAWAERRLAAIAGSGSRLRVGHRDLLFLPS